MSTEMLDGGAVKEVAALADVAGKIDGKFAEVTVDGQTLLVSPFQLNVLQPPAQPLPEPLALHTLSALGSYLEENRDGLDLKTITAHVLSPTVVEVVGPLFGPRAQRALYARAVFQRKDVLTYDNWYDLETVLVALQSTFAPTEERDALIGLLANVTAEESVQNTDDGMSQEVSVRAGVVRVSTAEVKNPVTLAPYRTFPDVAQPQSPFVVRLRTARGERTDAKLVEADGGAWALTAIAGIVERLEGILKGTGVNIIG